MYTAMVLSALCNMIYLALHVTGSSCFPQPLSTASSARARKKENIRFMVSASSQNKLE